MFDCDKIEKAKKEVTQKRSSMTKTDILLCIIILFVAVAFLFVFRFFGKEGSYAEILYDGSVLKQISLTQNASRYYVVTYFDKADETIAVEEMMLSEQTVLPEQAEMVRIQEFTQEQWEHESEVISGDYNVIVYRNGTVEMLQSNCPDQVCVHHTVISKTGESIICLPHKLVVQVTGAEENELDGVVY